jgi:hypothetical protein
MEQSTNSGPGSAPPAPKSKDNITGALILILLGLLFLANNLLPGFDFSDYWPLILVVVGISLLLRSR